MLHHYLLRLHQGAPEAIGVAWIIHGVATRGPTRYGRGA
jgi:hypothetical protein